MLRNVCECVCASRVRMCSFIFWDFCFISCCVLRVLRAYLAAPSEGVGVGGVAEPELRPLSSEDVLEHSLGGTEDASRVHEVRGHGPHLTCHGGGMNFMTQAHDPAHNRRVNTMTHLERSSSSPLPLPAAVATPQTAI